MTDSGSGCDRFRVRCDKIRVWLRQIQGLGVTDSGSGCDRFRVPIFGEDREVITRFRVARRYDKIRVGFKSIGERRGIWFRYDKFRGPGTALEIGVTDSGSSFTLWGGYQKLARVLPDLTQSPFRFGSFPREASLASLTPAGTMNSQNLSFFGENSSERPRRWVTVSNEMIMARLDWNIMMHRVLMVLISQIDSKNDEQFQTQRVPVSRIRDMAQVTQKSIHEEAAEAASKLVREPIEFWSPDKKDYEGYPIFAKCKYESRRGMIEAKFNEDARTYLLELRKHFTQYRLEQAIPLSTPYAIRTYEISKMIERPGERRSRQIPVERFRSMFRLENKYKRHCDMRRRVVDPSVEEVNKKTDVEISCDDVRDGQTPIALNWAVHSKKNPNLDEKTDTEPPRHNPEPKKKSKHERWFEELSSTEQEEIMKRARERARKNGYEESRPRSFSAGVMIMVSRIYKEEVANKS